MKWIGLMTGLMVCCALVAAGTGCRGTRGGSGGDPWDEDVLGPERLIDDGDMPMGARTEFGEQVMGLAFDAVYFGLDRFEVGAAERAKVEAAARYLQENPRLTLVVEGHTCMRGTREYNMALGERRAQAVRAYMIGLGVSSDRVYTVSFGMEKPAEPGRTEQAFVRNRRAEFVFYR